MATQDKVCSIAPYFEAKPGKLAAVKEMCERFVAKTAKEPKALYYGFSFDGDKMHCREAYADASGVLAHLDNVGSILEELLKIADLTRLEIHGPAEEIKKLREPLAPFDPQFFTLEYGFRK